MGVNAELGESYHCANCEAVHRWEPKDVVQLLKI
jgi:hypothetical protein